MRAAADVDYFTLKKTEKFSGAEPVQILYSAMVDGLHDGSMPSSWAIVRDKRHSGAS
jgi:hypothetical protein